MATTTGNIGGVISDESDNKLLSTTVSVEAAALAIAAGKFNCPVKVVAPVTPRVPDIDTPSALSEDTIFNKK